MVKFKFVLIIILSLNFRLVSYSQINDTIDPFIKIKYLISNRSYNINKSKDTVICNYYNYIKNDTLKFYYIKFGKFWKFENKQENYYEIGKFCYLFKIYEFRDRLKYPYRVVKKGKWLKYSLTDNKLLKEDLFNRNGKRIDKDGKVIPYNRIKGE